jgi:hypothetical protein
MNVSNIHGKLAYLYVNHVELTYNVNYSYESVKIKDLRNYSYESVKIVIYKHIPVNS